MFYVFGAISLIFMTLLFNHMFFKEFNRYILLLKNNHNEVWNKLMYHPLTGTSEEFGVARVTSRVLGSFFYLSDDYSDAEVGKLKRKGLKYWSLCVVSFVITFLFLVFIR